MLLFLPTDKQVPVSHAQSKVSRASNLKDSFNSVSKTSSVASRKTNPRESQLPSESLIWKSTMKNLKTSSQKTPKTIKSKWKHSPKLKLSFTQKAQTEKPRSSWCLNCVKPMNKSKNCFILVNLSEWLVLLKWTKTPQEVTPFLPFTTQKREAAKSLTVNTTLSIWPVHNVLKEQEPPETEPKKVLQSTRVCQPWVESSTFWLKIVPKENNNTYLTENQS